MINGGSLEPLHLFEDLTSPFEVVPGFTPFGDQNQVVMAAVIQSHVTRDGVV